MRIGLTGGTGFIGQWILKLFAGKYSFVVLTSGKQMESNYMHPDIRYVACDYSAESMKKVFSDCDCLVHLGAQLSTKEREESIFGYEENIRTSENLFLTAKELNIPNLVNISSRTVYDHSSECCFTEEMLPVPLNYYAVAKLTVEHMAAFFNQKYGMKIKTLRLAQIFGPGGRNGYMMEVFRQKAEAGEQIVVFDHQGKELLYVKDVAKAIICACKQPEKSGVYNIGSGMFYTNAQIAESFCKAYGSNAGYIYKEGITDVTMRTYMDVSLAKKELGFEADYSLEEAISDIRREK